MINKFEIMSVDNDHLDPMSTNFISNLKSKVLYHEITKQEQYRIDLISKNLYDSYDYYWILLAINDFKDISQLAAGEKLAYPPKMNIIMASRIKL